MINTQQAEADTDPKEKPCVIPCPVTLSDTGHLIPTPAIQSHAKLNPLLSSASESSVCMRFSQNLLFCHSSNDCTSKTDTFVF